MEHRTPSVASAIRRTQVTLWGDVPAQVARADAGNHAIREITFSGTNAVVTAVAGTLEDPSAPGFNPIAPIGVVVGGLPGELDEPWGLGRVSAGTKNGSGVTLAVTDEAENSVLLVNVN